MSDPETQAPIGSFASGADRYDRLRPEAPSEAVDFCVPLGAADVVDIVAGGGAHPASWLPPGTPGDGDELWEQQPPGPFEPRQRHTHSWSQSMTRADLRDLVTTRSYYLESGAPQQAGLVRAVQQAITADWPTLNDDDFLDLPYITTVLRYRRRP